MAPTLIPAISFASSKPFVKKFWLLTEIGNPSDAVEALHALRMARKFNLVNFLREFDVRRSALNGHLVHL